MKRKELFLDPLKVEEFSSYKLIKIAKRCQAIVHGSTEIAKKLKLQIMNGVDCRLANLLTIYVCIEKEIQKLIYQTSFHFCKECSSRCCKEEICRESIESAFLSILVEKQKNQYDTKNGWISPLGCSLDYGRPLVCYQFFCEEILESYLFKKASIHKIINEFASVGNKANGNTHLLCINNLTIISSTKIKKMINKFNLLMKKMANQANAVDAKSRGAD